MHSSLLNSSKSSIMFKFEFDIDDIDEELTSTVSKNITPTHDKPEDHPEVPFQELPITQLLDALPSLISYSPLTIPISSGKRSITLPRRDLFDARFQLISEGVAGPFQSESGKEEGNGLDQLGNPENAEDSRRHHASTLAYLDAPSDLLPGVYEGGLKTWECSLDLAEYLETASPFSRYEGKRSIELGCGTGVPSLYILRQLLLETRKKDGPYEETHIHLQDYNAAVLELVTLPNILLTWYASPASASFREVSELEAIDPSVAGELAITEELKAAFQASLKERNIHIRFFSGSWETFDLNQSGGNYNLLLTSETIYRTESLPSLVRVLSKGSSDSLDTLTAAKLTLKEAEGAATEPLYLCLVAAKVLYFGVGGGISDFVQFLSTEGAARKAKVETVLDKTSGVGRKVLRIVWS